VICRERQHRRDDQHGAGGAHLAAFGFAIPPASDRYVGGRPGVQKEGAASGGRHGGRGAERPVGVARSQRPSFSGLCP